jgi:hypothetical protein
MSLLNYWPEPAAINDCILQEAETLHDAVLLAVHKPTPISFKPVGQNEKQIKTEEDLFNHLITENVQAGTHVMAITGISGVGKSHMVRLLAARLKNINQDDRYVIVRIPKSASLRQVVHLILNELPPEQRYEDVRAAVDQAFDEVKIENTVINFQAQLDIALRELAELLEPQEIANPDDLALATKIGHAKDLPLFMGDPVLVEHFRTQVFTRIVQRAMAGAGQPGEDINRVVDFLPEDFEIPADIDIYQAAYNTREYYQAILQSNNKQGIKEAVELLNEGTVIDQAIRQLFGLHQALGGTTLPEVILDIRRLLLQQNKELVILVEDFVALTGIQETLLKNVFIQEGIHAGIQNLATIRSVIAVTDGYLAGRDTILTRAGGEWILESQLQTPEAVVQYTRSLVASYLNAARWGEKALINRFQQQGMVATGQQNWIEPFIHPEDTDDTHQLLDAFGREEGIPLFPYTAQAIEYLARKILTQNNTLVFTPRFIINSILRGLLLPGRPAFVNQQFPPALDNINTTPNATVAQWLAASTAPAVRARYERVVMIWGNAPQTQTAIAYIPPQVFAAFHLEIPNLDFQLPPILPVIQPDTVQPVMQTIPTDEGFTNALEQWVQNNTPLPQNYANQIRQSIAKALNSRIDWDSERLSRRNIIFNDISIPNARGQGSLAANPIQIAENNQDRDGKLRLQLTAVVRFYHVNDGLMNYAECDDDRVWIAILTDRLMPQVLERIRAEAEKKLGIAIRLLSTNSRILGILEQGRTLASLAAFLFGQYEPPPEPAVGPDAFTGWNNLRSTASQVRTPLIQVLTRYCGSFQGTGNTAYAIDMTRVAACSLPDTITPNDLGQLVDENLSVQLQTMSEAKVRVRVNNALNAAITIRTEVLKELGDAFDKNVIANKLVELTDQLSQTGAWPANIGMEPQAFKALATAFSNSALVTSLQVLEKANEQKDKDFTKTISYMGRFNTQPLIIAQEFTKKSRRVIDAANARAATLEQQAGGINVQNEATAINTLFDSLQTSLNTLHQEN